MSLGDIPPLTSADFEALLKEGPLDDALLPYELLDPVPAPWLDPSPADSGNPPGGPLATGFDVTGFMPNAGVAATLPDMFKPQGSQDIFSDAFLAPLPEFAPMPGMPSDAFALPMVMGHADSSGGSGGLDGSGGSGGAAATSAGGATLSSAPVPAAPAPRKGRSTTGGGNSGGKKELSEEQKERIRAKNRRAQNRYREKQKAKSAAAEREYADTAAELERARLENLRLREQQTTMQQVLTVRESAMDMLQSGKAADDAEAGGLSCGCTSPDKCTCPKAGSRAGDLAKLLCGAPTQHAVLPPSGAQLPGEQAACPLTGLSLSQIAELKKTPPAVLQQNWKGIVQRLEVILQQMGAAKESADPTLAQRTAQLEQQLSDTLLEGQFFCFEHAIYQPTNVQKLFAASLDDGRSQISIEDQQHWEQVAAAVQFSPEQVQRLTAARARFLAAIDEVCSERRLLLDRLAAVQVPSSLRALQHATASWLQVHEATAELTANMAREHLVCMTFVRDAFGYVLTPHQKAVAAVRSFPFFPDVYSISTSALQAANALPSAQPQPLPLPEVPASPAAVQAAVPLHAQLHAVAAS